MTEGIRDGRVVDTIYLAIRGRRPLEGTQLQDFKALVGHYADDIVQKWIDYFVLHRSVQPEVITRRIKMIMALRPMSAEDTFGRYGKERLYRYGEQVVLDPGCLDGGVDRDGTDIGVCVYFRWAF